MKNDDSIAEFVSYDDFYAKNGRDQTGFGAQNSMGNSRKKRNISPQELYDLQRKRRDKIAKKSADEKLLRENLRDGNLQNVEFKITKITPAAQTAGRYNIFVNDDFSFSLDETQLVRQGLKKGEILPADRYLELKGESDFGKNYIRAVDLVSRRLRSEREIRDYAFRKQWTPENRDRVIARLYERGYLNDERFAEAFVRSRATMKNISRRKLILDLRKKGISPEICEKVLAKSEEYDEKSALQKLVEKKRNKYDDERKFIAYLARQGFGYDDIKNALAETDEII